MTVLIDDHLLRDWMARRDSFLIAEIAGENVATTNLWYARLCKSAAASGPGALLGGWSPDERRALMSGLVALDDNVIVEPMRPLAWPMGVLVADHRGLSALGAEAVAAARHLDARILVSARDDGAGIRQCCKTIGIRYDTLHR